MEETIKWKQVVSDELKIIEAPGRRIEVSNKSLSHGEHTHCSSGSKHGHQIKYTTNPCRMHNHGNKKYTW